MATNSNTGRQWSPGPSSSTARPSTSSTPRRRPRGSPTFPRSPTGNRAPSSSPKGLTPAEGSRPSSTSSSCSEDHDNTCAICLSKPSNKCFTDACYHRFCFSCLVEWSRVKPTCPLCLKPFRTIVHNIKENYEFEQYHIFQHARPSPTSHSSTERVRIYESYHYARLNNLTRYRDISPEFFMNNPAQTHRLIPWLNRELLALLPPHHNLQLVMELILMMICRVDIRGAEMRQFLDLYLRPHTEHFQHEFFCFAYSPHDMPTFDRTVQYDYRPPVSYQEAVERLRRAFERDSMFAVEMISAPLRSQGPEFSAFRPWSPQAGPSGQPNAHSPQPSTSGAQPAAPQMPGPSNPGPSNPGPSSPVTLIIDSSSEDEDCQIVKVIKPTRERSPVLIDLCDSGSEQDTIPAQTPPHVRESDLQEEAPQASTNRPRSMIGAYYPGSAPKTYDTDESTEEEDGDAQNETTKRPKQKSRLSKTVRDDYAKKPRK